jgi:hypothetical protein
MKLILLAFLVMMLFVQTFTLEDDPEHQLLGIGKTYRYYRGYSSPWGRWGKGVWGKSQWGNPVYGGMSRSYVNPYGGGYGGFGRYSTIYRHDAADDSDSSAE